MEVSESFDLGADLSIVRRLSFLLKEFRPEWRELALDGLLGSVLALQRGLDEGWIDGEPFDEIHVDGLGVRAVGPPVTIQLLLFVVDALLGAFEQPTGGGPLPTVELVDIAAT